MSVLFQYLPKVWFTYQCLFLKNINYICEFTRYTSKKNYFRFYLTRTRSRYSKIRNILGLENTNSDFIKLKIGKNTIFIVDEILSIIKVLSYFKDLFNETDLENELVDHLCLSFYELQRLKNQFDFKKIKSVFHNAEQIKNGIIIKETIYPNKIFYGSPPRIYKLPKEFSTPINSIKITTDIENYICSIKIDSKHPNCDCFGYYCVDQLDKKKLDIESIKEIISKLEVYNFSSFYYFIPEGLIFSI